MNSQITEYTHYRLQTPNGGPMLEGGTLRELMERTLEYVSDTGQCVTLGTTEGLTDSGWDQMWLDELEDFISEFTVHICLHPALKELYSNSPTERKVAA